jgi:hypothetical protein
LQRTRPRARNGNTIERNQKSLKDEPKSVSRVESIYEHWVIYHGSRLSNVQGRG